MMSFPLFWVLSQIMKWSGGNLVPLLSHCLALAGAETLTCELCLKSPGRSEPSWFGRLCCRTRFGNHQGSAMRCVRTVDIRFLPECYKVCNLHLTTPEDSLLHAGLKFCLFSETDNLMKLFAVIRLSIWWESCHACITVV